jgi:hypothetical protein
MEGLVDVPLHQVRVFRNSISGALASSQHADAVTVENQVHMAPAKGTASTPSGEALLAHEVSHYAARLAGGPASRAVSPQQEEAQAQATEHAVRQQSESVSQPPKAQPPAATLDHLRAAPAAAAQATRASDGSRTAFSGGSAPAFSVTGGAASASMVLARAPVNRIPETGQGAAPSLPSPAAGGAQPGAAALDDGRNEPDEATMVGRVVEAVMRRLRRESALERERRGAFRSEIGG